MYKYEFGIGSKINVKTPKVNNIKDIKFNSEQSSECIKSCYEYPNGLVLKIEQYADKIIWETNKKLILLDDGKFIFED